VVAGLTGPGKATAIENLLSALKIPYPAACVIVALLIGPGGAIAAVYLESHSIVDAYAKTTALFLGATLSPASSFVGLFLLSLSLYYILYGVQYMRLRLVRSRQQLLSLLPNGEGDFEKAFSRVSSTWPPMLLAIALGFALGATAFLQLSSFADGIPTTIYLVFAYPLWFFALFTFVWIFVTAIRGLYDLGRLQLHLKPFSEDRMFGLHAFGSLALFFSAIYFAGLALIAYPVADSPITVTVLLLFVGFGLFLFLLPLFALHEKMSSEKYRERLKLVQMSRGYLSRFEESSLIESGFPRTHDGDGDPDSPSEATLADVRSEIRALLAIQAIEINRREVDSLPSWPFDTSIASRITAILLAVIGAIVARYVQILLGIG